MQRLLLCLILSLLFACNKTNSFPLKNTLRLNLFTEPPTLDPRKATDSTSMNVLLNVFEGLTRIGEDHLPKPAIAKSIEISSDKRTYTFYLREAYWSNGDPVTAEDFLYAWQTILNPQFPSPFAYKLYCIENAKKIKNGKLSLNSLGVKALNEKTLQVTLKYPIPFFLELTSLPTYYPIHKKNDLLHPEWHSDSIHYISNGPFQLKTWDHENEILLIRNSRYWDVQAVKLNALYMPMIDDVTTEFYMFEMNELDWTGSPFSNLPSEFISSLHDENNSKHFPIHFYAATAVYYLKLNTQHYPLNNLYIRKALASSICRKDIVEHITQAGQIPALALIPSMPGYTSPPHLFEDDNEVLAKQLFQQGLEELGITCEQFPSLAFYYNTNREHQKIAEAIQQQWKKVLGIEVNLSHFDWKVYLAKISSQEYDIARMGWVGDFYDPVSFLEPFKYNHAPNTEGNNDTGWENPKYISYLDQAEQEIDGVQRAHLLRKAESLLISEMPIIPIYYIVNAYLKKSYVHGVNLSPLGMADFKRAYITRKTHG